MKTKALLLGAKTRPLEGAWVPIAEAERWLCRTDGFPLSGDFRENIDLEVQQSNGEVAVLSAFEEIAGVAARVIVKEEIEGIDIISVYLESQ